MYVCTYVVRQAWRKRGGGGGEIENELGNWEPRKTRVSWVGKETLRCVCVVPLLPRRLGLFYYFVPSKYSAYRGGIGAYQGPRRYFSRDSREIRESQRRKRMQFNFRFPSILQPTKTLSKCIMLYVSSSSW
jgi:hypothetical protein